MNDIGQSETRLSELRAQLQDCAACPLHNGRKTVVFGEGNPRARLMFVGEGPGATEDEMGRPFVGAAGRLLDKIIEAGGWRREEVYIANVVKCRPPGNRVPTAEEMASCLPNLLRQIELIQPQLLVCLGATAAQGLIDAKIKITRARGDWVEKYGIRIMPTFHPAALLRDPSRKRDVWEDIKKVHGAYLELLEEDNGADRDSRSS